MLAIFAAQGCESEESCVVGRAVACACTDGRSGAQTCLADLTYGPCVCTSDGGGTDAGGSDGGEFDAGPPSDGGAVDVERVMPTGDRVYVRDTLMIQARVRSGSADRVEIHIDGELLVELVPPYSYVWDTRTEDEREYTLTIHAFFGAREAVTPPLAVVVDRTAPSVVERTPAEGATNVWLWDPITLRMSEPVLASTVTESSIVVSGMGAASLRKTTTLAADEMSLEIALDSRPTLPSDVSVDVTPAITDYAGNPAIRDSWSFNAPEWSTVPIDFDVPDVYLAGLEARARNSIFVLGRPTSLSGFHVAEWDGTRWRALGGLVGSGSAGSVCANDAGDVFVAWIGAPASGAGSAVRVAQWNGSAWVETEIATGSYSTLGFACEGSTVVLSAATRSLPYVIDLWRWDGASWEALERPPVPSDAVGTPALASRSDGEVLLVSTGSSGSAYRYDGAWRTEAMPPVLIQPSLAYNDVGDAFLGGVASGSSVVWRLNGSEWRALYGEISPSSFGTTVAIDGGRVLVSYARTVAGRSTIFSALVDADTMIATPIGSWDGGGGGNLLFDTSNWRDLYRASGNGAFMTLERWNGR